MQTKTFNILLIDDNEDHAELIMRTLARNPHPCSVSHVSDGVMAMEYLSITGGNSSMETREKPDLILLDLRLPRIDGLEVLRKIKSTDSTMSIPTLVLTTSRARRDIEDAYRYHANGYMVKPLDYSLLINLMNEMANYWIKCNVTPER